MKDHSEKAIIDYVTEKPDNSKSPVHTKEVRYSQSLYGNSTFSDLMIWFLVKLPNHSDDGQVAVDRSFVDFHDAHSNI